MIHLCRKFEKLFCLLDTNISRQGPWDPMGHLIENLDQGSRGLPMVDPRRPGPMKSGPHLGPRPVAMMQPRRLARITASCHQGLLGPTWLPHWKSGLAIWCGILGQPQGWWHLRFGPVGPTVQYPQIFPGVSKVKVTTSQCLDLWAPRSGLMMNQIHWYNSLPLGDHVY